MNKVIDARRFDFFFVDHAIIDDERANAHDIAVYSAICKHEDGSETYNVDLLAKKLKLSVEQINTSMKNLKSCGYLG